jgi:hypothetical protein
MLTPGINVIKYCRNLPQYLHFLGLKYYGKLLQYLSLPPRDNVLKLFSMVTYCLSMGITAVILFYNTACWPYLEMMVNYFSKMFYNIGPDLFCNTKNVQKLLGSNTLAYFSLASNENKLYHFDY